MKYFTLEECIYSATAISKHIDNTPNAEQEAHIVESIETLIIPLREAWERHCEQNELGKAGINISSGFRCPELNAAVGGAKNSAHCSGYAFDLIPANGEMMDFKHFCHEFLSTQSFDQLISEGESHGGMPSWMHVGYKHPDGCQRKEFLSMIDGKYYPMTK